MPNISEVERNAQELQERLHNFSAATNTQRETGLRELCDSFSNVDAEVLACLVDAQ